MPVQRWSERIWVAQVARDPAFTEELDSLLVAMSGRSPAPSVVVDLSGVEYVNSANLAQLLKLRKQLVDAESQLRIAAPPNQVWAVFLATGLDKVFHFAESTSTALAELQMTSEGRDR